MSNLNESYKQATQIIPRVNFANLDNTVHNNLGNNLLTENIVEYHINMDSDDRKLDAYPDPFHYVVTFKSLGRSSYHTKYRGFKVECGEVPETPGPVIMRSFKNVKYVTLDHVILSRYNVNKYTIEHVINICDGKLVLNTIGLERHCHRFDIGGLCFLCRFSKIECVCAKWDLCEECFGAGKKCICKLVDICHTCENFFCQCMINDHNKFLILRIKELKNNRIYSTNTGSSDNSFILLVDKLIGNCQTVWISRNGGITFPSSLLQNIERLTIEFCDHRGERIKMGVVLQFNIVVNGAFHRVNVIFGCVHPLVLVRMYGLKIMLPIWELTHPENWYTAVFQNLLSHIHDKELIAVLELNFPLFLSQIAGLGIWEIVRCEITNNVFLILGVMQNELNTNTNYEN
ncbi:MAG: hypothetical protein Hyperionvirus20_25 [Hyperionvirus sp.]|uniref:Uncharacterized protein n=1 Tax=Hyperionvirus sp. TaxID=2487770 RepID=A0A3G5AAJ8_9VIRU|nr:MAG: hypothetical protein Hyperionvirus20_25 [Hyperionvirus sp.]